MIGAALSFQDFLYGRKALPSAKSLFGSECIAGVVQRYGEKR